MSHILFEFQKLEWVDVRVAFWLADNDPDVLPKYFEFIQSEYVSKGVFLDVKTLVKEFGWHIASKQ